VDHNKLWKILKEMGIPDHLTCLLRNLYAERRGFTGGLNSKESACNAGDLGLIRGLGRSLEKGMATHSSILAWKIP